MTSKILITGAIFCAITTTSAHAVMKCVALNSSDTRCTTVPTQYEYHTDWAATCTTNGVSTPISGIGICSSTDGSRTGATATELDTSSNTDENKHCWCKMTSPAVSPWVFAYTPVEAASCFQLCARRCSDELRKVALRSALFGSLSD